MSAPKKQRWAVVAPDGRAGYYNGDLAEAIAKGYKPRGETQRELAKANVAEETGLQAGLEGAARGLTFGLSDPLLATDPGEAEMMRARSKTGAGTAGEVAGTVGAIFGPGALGVGGKLLGGAGKALSSKLGGKLLGRMTGGALEGSLFGLTNAVSESTLENQPLTSEYVASAMAAGGLFGGGAGGAFYGLEKGIKSAAAKLAKVDVAGMAGKLADEADLAMLRKANGGPHPYEGNMLKVGRREGILGGKASYSNYNSVDAAKQAQARIGGELGVALDQLDARVPFSAQNAGKAIRDALKPLARNPVYQPVIEGPLTDLVNRIYGGQAQAPRFGWRDAFELQSSMRSALEGGNLASNAKKKVFDVARKALRDHIADTVEAKLHPGAGRAFRDALADYGSAAELEKIFTRAHEAYQKSPLNMLAGGEAAMGLVMGHPVMGVGAAIAQKALQPRWGFLLSDAIRSGGPLIQRFGRGLEARMSKLAGSAAFAPFQLLLEDAASHGSAALLAEHARIAKSADGPEYLAMMGMPAENPELMEDSLARAGSMHAAASYADAMNERAQRQVAGFFGEKAGKMTAIRTGDFDGMQARLGKIRALLDNPTSAYEAIPETLAGAAPNVSGQAAATLIRAAQYLSDQAPKDPYAGQPQALRRAWKPSPTEINRWFRILDAIERPGAVVERMRAGRVDAEQLKALEYVYPALNADFQLKVAEKLGTWEKKLDPARKNALAKWTGGNLGMSQGAASLLQQMHQQKAGPAPKPRDGRQKIDVQENVETQAQRLERR
jgi:hypothetical protein